MNRLFRVWFIIAFMIVWGRGELHSQPWLLNPWQGYNRLSHNTVTDSADSVHIGLMSTLLWENSPVYPAELYTTSLRFAFLPYLHIKISDKMTVNFRFFLENKTDQYMLSDKKYYGHYFGSGQGDVEIGTIQYKNGPFVLKFGRDYLRPDSSFYEGLQFSRFQYSYDQLSFQYTFKIFSLQSFYASLDGLYGKYRQLYGHILKIHPSSTLLLQIMDIGLYGNNSRNLNITLLNPFIPFFISEYNNKAGGNNTISMSVNWEVSDKISLYSEFLLDDYQIEKKDTMDLEPAEFGISQTVCIKSVIPRVKWLFNYTKVSNRTFNVVNPYEKMIFRNLPIGHFAGNNFWELKSSVVYNNESGFASELTVYYRESGDEALYAPFNEDFLNYSIEEGYSEPFPFGTIHKQAGFWWDNYWQLNKYILFQGTLAYWKQQYYLPKDLAIRFALSFRI